MNSKMPKTLLDVMKHLYKMKDDFPYTQLSLCLDQKSFFDLMRVFGGQNLYIPTTEEFIRLLQFCIVDEIGDYEQAYALNQEVLSGLTETRYRRMFENIYHRPYVHTVKGNSSEGGDTEPEGTSEQPRRKRGRPPKNRQSS